MKRLVLVTLFTFILLLGSALSVSAEENAVKESGTFDGVDWRITEEGQLLLGAEGETQTFTYSDDRRNYPWANGYKGIQSIGFAGDVAGNGNMAGMFAFAYYFDGTSSGFGGGYAVALQTIDLTGFDTSRVTSMRDMFSGCIALQKLDLSGFDTSQVTDMSGMFRECCKLQLQSLDLSSFNTSNVTDMSEMFEMEGHAGYVHHEEDESPAVSYWYQNPTVGNAFTELDLRNFDTGKVTDMHRMFYGCTALERLDLSSFNTRNVPADDASMFLSCAALKWVALGEDTLITLHHYKGNEYEWRLVSTLDGDAVSGPILANNSKYDGSAPGWYERVPARPAQKLVVKSTPKKLKVKTLKKKAKTVKPITVKKSRGDVTYAVTKGSAKAKKALTVNKKTGAVKVRKNTKKGTYSLKVRVSATGDMTYGPASKTVKVTVVVK